MSFYLTKIPSKESLTNLCELFGVDPKALSFGLNLRVIVGRWERRFEQILQQYDLAGGRFSIMAHLLLAEPHGCKASELAEKMGVTRGNMTSLVESLFKKKYITRAPHEEDRRAVVLHLGPAGKRLMEKLGPDYFAIYDELFAKLGSKPVKDWK